jgi:UDP-N-acetylmuramoyl-L-alanyl-D-glutamate--2,6-diaminopimelate ligase
MRLFEFTEWIKIPAGAEEVEVGGLANDSRKVKPGDLFIAIPGFKTNGLFFLEEAISRGACAAIIEEDNPGEFSIPIIRVTNIREIQGLVAAHFYGWPSRQLRMIGITGTNGKTTVTHLIEHILRADHHQVGLIGTVWTDDGRVKQQSERTTPDSIDLQRSLAIMVRNGIDTVVMEVSSHALAQNRVIGIDFDVAVITNVTHDHFDFHHNYQNYLQSKLLLFKGLKKSSEKKRYAVANREDASFLKIAEVCRVPVFDYGFTQNASVWVRNVKRQGFLSTINLDIHGEECRITTGLPGGFNILNILAALTVCHHEGVPIEDMEKAVADFPGIPGRYQEIICGQPFRVMVDFAHNPAALENILKMARENTRGRRIIVFGCEGEKDRLKRPLMGKIAVSNSEIPILTVDNIHHEKIEQIFSDVLKDLSPHERERIIVEPDRGAAIQKAIKLAKPGDYVIVAGKGHEEFLIKGSTRFHFSDAEVIREILYDMKID